MKKPESKSFIIPIKESIISKLFKILNYNGNIGKKKYPFYQFFVVKLVIYPGFSNALSEMLRIYTFLVWSLFSG